MKFTLSWLKDFLDTNATLSLITDTLTSIGLEVENVVDHSVDLKAFVVAEIVEAVQHPNADKLRVCKVNDGAGVRQVVCGAPNARAGIKVVLAKEGVKIPANGMVIKKSAIRNVESNGMLCSAHELGIGEDGGGIIELPAYAIPGEPVVDVLGLNDQTIDIAITPNRSDCLSVYGIARDLSAAGLGTLKEITPPQFTGQGASPIQVKLEMDACPLFIGCYIKGVKNKPSPEWLQNRLKAIGLRPISTLVDITNYMTFTYGRPLHVYDADKLQGDILVRSAKDGETLIALNDKEYTLSSGVIAITDDSGAIGLGGIIGGTSTGCSEETTNVFLEAALFDPVHIANTGRKLAIDSDARYRFERGIDPEFTKTGATIAANLIVELCGGIASDFVIAGKVPNAQRSIKFDYSKVESLGSITLPKEQIDKILVSLGCNVEGDTITPPSWRADIEGSADLVEEILRITGYENIPSLTLPETHNKSLLLPQQQRASLIRKSLASSGMNEISSWAFLSEAQAKQFGGNNPALKLINPISPDLDTMRPNLLPNIIAAAARNASRGFSSLALFEIGNVFENITLEGHKFMAAGVRTNEAVSRNHFKNERLVDVFDAKADLFHLLEVCGLNPTKLHIDRNVPSWYHPTRAGRISLGGKVTLGYFGEIHPLVLSSFDIKFRVVAFEALLHAIPLPKAKGKAKPLFAVSNFQEVERDFAFIADANMAASDIVKAIEGADKLLIQAVKIFDIYSGKGVQEGKKSVAISVTLQAPDKTLNDQEIEALSQKIIASVATLGLALRQ